MAVSIYMKITSPTIDGGETIKGNEKSFEVLSLTYSAASVAGHTSYSPVTVTCNAFNGPDLMRVLSDKKQKPSIKITVYKTNVNGQLVAFETISFSKATINLFQETATKGSAEPIFELAIDGETFEYIQVDDGHTFSR